jgi:hypothetical protein
MTLNNQDMKMTTLDLSKKKMKMTTLETQSKISYKSILCFRLNYK